MLAALTADDGSDAYASVRDLRVSRTELGLLAGAALGAAGLMRGGTRNPLAESGTLGVNAGAAFAVVLAIKLLRVGTTLSHSPGSSSTSAPGARASTATGACWSGSGSRRSPTPAPATR